MAPKKKSVAAKRRVKPVKKVELQDCKMPWKIMAEKRRKEKMLKQNKERVRKYRENMKKKEEARNKAQEKVKAILTIVKKISKMM